jgi:hypothetical protein
MFFVHVPWLLVLPFQACYKGLLSFLFKIPTSAFLTVAYKGPVKGGHILQCVLVLEVHKTRDSAVLTHAPLSVRLPNSSGNRDNKSRTGDLIKSSIEVAISGEKRETEERREKDVTGKKRSL